MAACTTTEREAQRVRHLVLGEPRPRSGPAPRNAKGRRAKPRALTLAPGIEEAVQLRERWSHKANGTPETHEYAHSEGLREGSLARLVRSGAIDAHQLAAAQEIATAFAEVTSKVAPRTARWEQASPGTVGDESVSQHLRAVAYSRWRAEVGPHGAMLLAIIVDDVGLVAAARRWRLSNRRAKAVLILALDRWRRK